MQNGGFKWSNWEGADDANRRLSSLRKGTSSIMLTKNENPLMRGVLYARRRIYTEPRNALEKTTDRGNARGKIRLFGRSGLPRVVASSIMV
jgi:hypothetical protein